MSLMIQRLLTLSRRRIRREQVTTITIQARSGAKLRARLMYRQWSCWNRWTIDIILKFIELKEKHQGISYMMSVS